MPVPTEITLPQQPVRGECAIHPPMPPKFATTERAVSSKFKLLVICFLFSRFLFSGVSPPPKKRLCVSEVFNSETGKPNPRVLMEYFMLEGRLDDATAIKILKDGAAILKSEENLIKVQDPVNGSTTFSFVEIISTVLFELFFLQFVVTSTDSSTI